jgi:hypothetical protein
LEERECLTRNNKIPSGCHQDSSRVLMATVETARVDPGAVTSHHSKQVVRSPNEPLKGRQAYITKDKNI